MTNSPVLTARHYAWITLGFVAFVIYGSLVPLTFRAVPFDRAWKHFAWCFSRPVEVAHRSDWLANILLFIPLGFVAMGWRSVDRHISPLAIGLLLLGFVVLSTQIEFAQIYFPPRDTSINDVVAETFGGAIGIGIWLVAGRRLTDYVRCFWMNHGEHNWAIRLIPGYLLILVIAQGMPFDLTLSPSTLARKYRAGRIHPIPFTLYGDEPLDLVRKALINFAYFAPAGVLIAGLPRRIAAGRNAVWRVFGLGLLLTGANAAMQLIVVTRYCDATDILTGTLAVVIGWRLMRLYRSEAIAGRGQQLLAKIFLAWVAALAFINWEPFNFTLDSDFLTRRWREFSFVPFADYDAGNYLSSFSAMLDTTLLFAPFGLLLASATNARPRVIVASAILLAFLLEAGQFCLRRHTPGVSDLILEPIGAWLGCLMAPRMRLFVRADHTTEPAGLRAV